MFRNYSWYFRPLEDNMVGLDYLVGVGSKPLALRLNSYQISNLGLSSNFDNKVCNFNIKIEPVFNIQNVIFIFTDQLALFDVRIYRYKN
jgi:hypothetical protein